MMEWVRRVWGSKRKYNPHMPRSGVSPFAVRKANVWKHRLTLAYAFVAFNAFALVLYSSFKGKLDWADYYGLKSDREKTIRPGEAWMQFLGVKKATVLQIKNFSVSGSYEIDEADVAGEERDEKN